MITQQTTEEKAGKKAADMNEDLETFCDQVMSGISNNASKKDQSDSDLEHSGSRKNKSKAKRNRVDSDSDSEQSSKSVTQNCDVKSKEKRDSDGQQSDSHTAKPESDCSQKVKSRKKLSKKRKKIKKAVVSDSSDDSSSSSDDDVPVMKGKRKSKLRKTMEDNDSEKQDTNSQKVGLYVSRQALFIVFKYGA